MDPSQKVRKWRKENGYNLTQASEAVGLPLNIISKIERKKLKPNKSVALEFEKVGVHLNVDEKPLSEKVNKLHNLINKMLRKCEVFFDECDGVVTITIKTDQGLVRTIFSKHNLDQETDQGIKNQAIGLARELVSLYERRVLR